MNVASGALRNSGKLVQQRLQWAKSNLPADVYGRIANSQRRLFNGILWGYLLLMFMFFGGIGYLLFSTNAQARLQSVGTAKDSVMTYYRFGKTYSISLEEIAFSPNSENKYLLHFDQNGNIVSVESYNEAKERQNKNSTYAFFFIMSLFVLGVVIFNKVLQEGIGKEWYSFLKWYNKGRLEGESLDLD